MASFIQQETGLKLNEEWSTERHEFACLQFWPTHIGFLPGPTRRSAVDSISVLGL